MNKSILRGLKSILRDFNEKITNCINLFKKLLKTPVFLSVFLLIGCSNKAFFNNFETNEIKNNKEIIERVKQTNKNLIVKHYLMCKKLSNVKLKNYEDLKIEYVKLINNYYKCYNINNNLNYKLSRF